jgi:hypothetical protein
MAYNRCARMKGKWYYHIHKGSNLVITLNENNEKNVNYESYLPHIKNTDNADRHRSRCINVLLST